MRIYLQKSISIPKRTSPGDVCPLSVYRSTRLFSDETIEALRQRDRQPGRQPGSQAARQPGSQAARQPGSQAGVEQPRRGAAEAPCGGLCTDRLFFRRFVLSGVLVFTELVCM